MIFRLPSGLRALSTAALCICPAAALAQAAEGVERMLVDADALVVSIEVTTRCALFDSTLRYLTPLEQVGAQLRLAEVIALATSEVDDIADRLARMHEQASRIACGSEELVPYMDFGRQVARDVIDIALVAWRGIDIGRCNYFADDDFLRAAELARSAGAEANIVGEPNRAAYIEERATAWVEIFEANCANLQFNPVETLPGQIALALPEQS